MIFDNHIDLDVHWEMDIYIAKRSNHFRNFWSEVSNEYHYVTEKL